MARSTLLAPWAAMILAGGWAAWGAPQPGPPPTTYELMINGESFLVEANRSVKLQSKEKPGVMYQVAIRVAPVQALKLDALQFQYDHRSQVEDNRQPERRSVKLRHELGFTMLITDLGPPLEKQNREKALEILTQSVQKSVVARNVKSEEPTVTRLPDHQFEGAEGRGNRIRYRDAEGIDHSTLVYILVGKTFTASCIVQFLDNDSQDVLPLVRDTLDSIRALDQEASPAGKDHPSGGR